MGGWRGVTKLKEGGVVVLAATVGDTTEVFDVGITVLEPLDTRSLFKAQDTMEVFDV